MTITSTPVDSTNIPNHVGDKVMNMGTYESDLTNGNIDTGLGICEVMLLTPSGTALVTAPPSVISALPTEGDSIAIVTPEGIGGIWMAVGSL